MSYKTNILEETSSNSFFRKVLYTGNKTQLVVMHLNPGEEIGEEVHAHVEQVLFNMSGRGKVLLDGVESDFLQGEVVIVSPGVKHNFINIGNEVLKIYTIYSPANHIDGRIHHTKAEADSDSEDEEYGHSVV
jgi:mannose-6-phosphate isomerase-like protein (cupin superfamily)